MAAAATSTSRTTAPKTLAEALLAVQKSAPSIQKDKINPAFKGSRYASTDSILADVLPVLNANGLVLTQTPSFLGFDNPVPALRTRITFVPTGDFIEDVGLLMLDKQNAQGLGGAITYMRRYAVTSLLGLVTEVDDDGNSASESEVEVVNKRSSRAPKAAANDKQDAGW